MDPGLDVLQRMNAPLLEYFPVLHMKCRLLESDMLRVGSTTAGIVYNNKQSINSVNQTKFVSSILVISTVFMSLPGLDKE